jgi:DNA replication protein DnaC
MCQAREAALCPVCKGKRFLVHDVPPGDDKFNELIPCGCTLSAHVQSLRTQSGLDPDQYDWRFANTKVLSQLAEAFKAAMQLAAKPQYILGLFGSYGVGKTRLGVCVVNAVVDQGLPAIYKRPSTLLDDLRAGFRPDAGDEYRDTWERFVNTKVLFLDEFHRFNATPWAVDRVVELIEARYEGGSRKLTILAGNMSLEDLPGNLKSRLQDGRCTLFDILGPDIRPHLH